VDPPTGDVSPTTDTAVADQEQAQSSDAADTTADDVGPTADVAPAAALASTVSETTDPKAVTCRDSMIKIRRAKKSTPPVDPPVYAVWCIERYEFPGKGRTPRTNVSQEKAAALCAKRDARLCTRSEWRIACGGKYPYKGEFDPSTCNSAAPGPTARPIKPAGSKLRCRSGWGAYDMVGNVSEWTADGHVIGGSARGDAERGTCYRSVPRKAGGSDVGFRCCADPTPTETKK